MNLRRAPANDDQRSCSDAIVARGEDDLERTRAWILCELAEDDSPHGALTADLAVVDHRLMAAGVRPTRMRTILSVV